MPRKKRDEAEEPDEDLNDTTAPELDDELELDLDEEAPEVEPSEDEMRDLDLEEFEDMIDNRAASRKGKAFDDDEDADFNDFEEDEGYEEMSTELDDDF